MFSIGCHLSSSGGFLAMGETARRIGATTFQFFTRNPRGSRAKAIDPADAAVLRTRISELRAAARAAQDREEAERLKRRIAELQVLRRQSSELAELTKRYYERNYHRDERYTL